MKVILPDDKAPMSDGSLKEFHGEEPDIVTNAFDENGPVCVTPKVEPSAKGIIIKMRMSSRITV